VNLREYDSLEPTACVSPSGSDPLYAPLNFRTNTITGELILAQSNSSKSPKKLELVSLNMSQGIT